MRRAIIPAFLLLLGSAVLGATVLRDPIAHAAVPITSVFVTNDSSHSVPVREQNLDGGNVKVHEQGTVSVRSADQEVSARARASSNVANGCGGALYTVPAGKQLVVKYISAFGIVINATSAAGEINYAVTGENTAVELPVVFQAQGPDVFAASESVNFVVPPGSQIYFNATFRGGPNECSVHFALGGVLQPVP
jgi:hypothetical protein